MWCLMMTCNHTDYRELVTTALPTAELAASFLGIATDSSHGLTLTKAELVGTIGKVVILYRRRRDGKPTIVLEG